MNDDREDLKVIESFLSGFDPLEDTVGEVEQALTEISQARRDAADSWLKLAVDEGLSVSELRRRIKPPQPKPKRWTLEQLRTDLDDWCSEYLDEKKLVRCATCSITREWLDWLEGQEATDEHP